MHCADVDQILIWKKEKKHKSYLGDSSVHLTLGWVLNDIRNLSLMNSGEAMECGYMRQVP